MLPLLPTTFRGKGAVEWSCDVVTGVVQQQQCSSLKQKRSPSKACWVYVPLSLGGAVYHCQSACVPDLFEPHYDVFRRCRPLWCLTSTNITCHSFNMLHCTKAVCAGYSYQAITKHCGHLAYA